MALAERIRSSVEGMQIPHQTSPLGGVVTVSLGIATAVPVSGEVPGAFLERADAALYEAKRGGRNAIRAAASSTSSS